MKILHRIISQLSPATTAYTARFLKEAASADKKIGSLRIGCLKLGRSQFFSSKPGDGNRKDWDINSVDGTNGSDLGWDNTGSSWSLGLTKEHFDGEVVGSQITHSDHGGVTSPLGSKVSLTDAENDIMAQLEAENRRSKAYVDSWNDRLRETAFYLNQVREPGARGSYLKDSEKAEMYRLHKENPQVYTVERLAKDYRIMRQRVLAIIWLKEDEEQVERNLGHPLDDSIEQLLDNFPEFFISHDREFHVASLPYKPQFTVMPEGWDGTARDPDEVHYEISMREDEMLYQEFVERMNFNKMQLAGEVRRHKYSRRRPNDGWKFIVEKLGSKGKRGAGGGWKFASMPDGSSRPLDEKEKMYVRRETIRRRSRILPPIK